jgi:MoaA/NifB/PqqE/SkfB family radical SAM enzyme
MIGPFSWMIFALWPKRAQIEITTRCNLDCPMCPRRRLGLKGADMDFGVFRGIIDGLSSVREITLSGWGEPLMHPDLAGMIDYSKSRGKRIKLTTNGLMMNERDIEILKKVDEVNFSIDEVLPRGSPALGHRNGGVFLKIKELAASRGRNKRPFIRVQSIYYGSNKDDIFEILERAKALGADSAKVMRVNPVYGNNLPRIRWEETVRFYKDIVRFAKKIKLRVDLVNYAFSSGIKNILYKIFVNMLAPSAGITCTKAINFIYITVDGRVLPTGCGELYGYTIGGISEDLGRIWDKKAFKDFRRDHSAFCDPGCIFSMKKGA